MHFPFLGRNGVTGCPGAMFAVVFYNAWRKVAGPDYRVKKKLYALCQQADHAVRAVFPGNFAGCQFGDSKIR